MDTGLWLGYAAAAAALLFLPGPDWAFMLATGVRQGRVGPAVAGLTIGYVILALVVAAGIGPLIANQPAVLVAVTVAGAAYLVFLGVGVVRTPRPAVEPSAPARALVASAIEVSSVWPVIRRGVGVSALNAKSLVLFVAFLPQFLSTSAPWPVWVQLAVLGLTWSAMGAVFYLCLGASSRRLLGGRPMVVHVITRITGVAMILMGLLLAGEQLSRLVAAAT